MSRTADWNAGHHHVGIDIAPALPPVFEHDAATSVCTCGWRSKTFAAADAVGRAKAAGGAHLAAAGRRTESLVGGDAR